MKAIKKNKERLTLESCLNKMPTKKRLRKSSAREEILNTFIKIHAHVTADALYHKVRQSYSGIGFATVYRTLHMLCESGFVRKFRDRDGVTRYEILWGKGHHDHLICLKCGLLIELEDTKLERFQAVLFRQNGFDVDQHRMDLYGTCLKCRRKKVPNKER